MIAELICVGTELLMGQVLNTNAHYIAKELAPSGVDMYHQIVVGDNPKRLTDAVETALSRAFPRGRRASFRRSRSDRRRSHEGDRRKSARQGARSL